MLASLGARFRSWLSLRKSRSVRSHRVRQDASVHRALTLRDIRGASESETFARRIGYLRKIDPLVFEELVLDAFKRHGYQVERGTRYSGDGGLDGKVFKDGQWYGIQCKRYRSFIKKEHLLQFPEDLAKFGLQSGFFVHTGRTPSDCKKMAIENVQIYSGQQLLDFLISARA